MAGASTIDGTTEGRTIQNRALNRQTPRVGIIGAGGIAPSHVEAWLALGVRPTVYSKNGSEGLAARFELASVARIEELYARADIVDIVTPTDTHRDLVLDAIAAGKHVVCEKPLGATSVAALEMAEAAVAADVHLYPAHVVRYFPEYAAIKQAVDDGRIGTPAVLRLSRAGQAPPAGSWFFEESLGGGIILDQLIHDLDQARWIAGDVTEVYAVQNPPTLDGHVPPLVTAHVVLTHAGGAISHVQGVWGPVGLTFSTSIDVAGSAGTLGYRSPNDGAITLEIPTASSGASYLPPQTHVESPFAHEMREFAAAFAGGPRPRVSAYDGAIAVALAEAAMRSIATRRPVPFDHATELTASTHEPARNVWGDAQ